MNKKLLVTLIATTLAASTVTMPVWAATNVDRAGGTGDTDLKIYVEKEDNNNGENNRPGEDNRPGETEKPENNKPGGSSGGTGGNNDREDGGSLEEDKGTGEGNIGEGDIGSGDEGSGDGGEGNVSDGDIGEGENTGNGTTGGNTGNGTNGNGTNGNGTNGNGNGTTGNRNDGEESSQKGEIDSVNEEKVDSGKTEENKDGTLESAVLFSATVPIEMEVQITELGEVYISNRARIVNNNKSKDIQVTEINVETGEDWSLTDYRVDTISEDNTRVLSMKLRNDRVEIDGSVNLTESDWKIGKDSSLPLNVHTRTPETLTGETMTGSIQFTLGWSDTDLERTHLVLPEIAVGSRIESLDGILVDDGENIKLPEVYVQPGYEFKGWINTLDESSVDENTIVNSDMIIRPVIEKV